MKKSTKCISIILSVILILSAVTTSFFAETVYEHNGLLYTKLNEDYVSVYGFEGDYTDIVIPDSVDEGYVYEISAFAIQNNTNITSIDLSKAQHLDSLKTMCFNGCISLSGNIYVPYLVTEVMMGAFQGCSSIENVDFAARTNLIPEVCFNRCTSLQKVKISESVTAIDKLAFANCPELSEVYIPSSVTDIHFTAFNNDEALVIYCYSGSYAQSYAIEYGYDYVLIDAPAPTEPATEPVTEPVTEATEATEPPTTPVEVSFILGDVDNSGNVDIVDATFAQRYATHVDIPEDILDGIVMRGDVDENDELDSSDVTFIMRHLIRVATPYSIGETVTRVI